MIRRLVTDPSVITALTNAVLSAFQPSLREHIVGQNSDSNNANSVAAPVGQSTRKDLSVDQTVEGQKRSRSGTVDLTDDEYFPPKQVARYEAPEDAEQNELGLDNTMASTSARWEASEELNALLNIMLKLLHRFER